MGSAYCVSLSFFHRLAMVRQSSSTSSIAESTLINSMDTSIAITIHHPQPDTRSPFVKKHFIAFLVALLCLAHLFRLMITQTVMVIMMVMLVIKLAVLMKLLLCS